MQGRSLNQSVVVLTVMLDQSSSVGLVFVVIIILLVYFYSGSRFLDPRSRDFMSSTSERQRGQCSHGMVARLN